jgi:hypothetical protein
MAPFFEEKRLDVLYNGGIFAARREYRYIWGAGSLRRAGIQEIDRRG